MPPHFEVPKAKLLSTNLGLTQTTTHKIALPGFEPGSQGPEPCMIGRYTTGLCSKALSLPLRVRLQG